MPRAPPGRVGSLSFPATSAAQAVAGLQETLDGGKAPASPGSLHMPPVGSVTQAGWYLSELTVPGNFPQDLRRISQLSPMESHVHAPREPGTAHTSPLHSPRRGRSAPIAPLPWSTWPRKVNFFSSESGPQTPSCCEGAGVGGKGWDLPAATLHRDPTPPLLQGLLKGVGWRERSGLDP